MGLLQTQTTLLVTLKTRPNNVWTLSAMSQLYGTMARYFQVPVRKKTAVAATFETGFFSRRRCAGTGPRANVSLGARRFASRSRLNPSFFDVTSLRKSTSFCTGWLWRVQPCGVHWVHHGGDNPGSEGRPGSSDAGKFVFISSNLSGWGRGFHPADLWDQPDHNHWAEGEARMWKSGEGKSDRPIFCWHYFPHNSGSVRKDVDSWGAILEGHQLPVS